MSGVAKVMQERLLGGLVGVRDTTSNMFFQIKLKHVYIDEEPEVQRV